MKIAINIFYYNYKIYFFTIISKLFLIVYLILIIKFDNNILSKISFFNFSFKNYFFYKVK